MPDHTDEAKRLYVSVCEIQQELGTSLYRRYLRETMRALAEEETPTDMLAFSSQLLMKIFAKHAERDVPAWCAPVSMSEYSGRKYENVQAELRKLYQTNRARWAVRGGDVILSVDPFEAHRLRAEVPDWLLKEGSKGGNIVMDRKGLEGFLEMRFRRRWLGVGYC